MTTRLDRLDATVMVRGQALIDRVRESLVENVFALEDFAGSVRGAEYREEDDSPVNCLARVQSKAQSVAEELRQVIELFGRLEERGTSEPG